MMMMVVVVVVWYLLLVKIPGEERRRKELELVLTMLYCVFRDSIKLCPCPFMSMLF
jgi:hypothetical protein